MAKNPKNRFDRVTDLALVARHALRPAGQRQADAIVASTQVARQPDHPHAAATATPPAGSRPKTPPPSAKPATPASRPYGQRRELKVALTAATVVILAAAGLTGYLVWPHSPASQTQSAGRQSGSTPIVPGSPSCAQPQALLATMSTRDKLAQLLMVGVTDAADARRVVTTDHVGGIFIASWTDLSMLRDGELTAIAALSRPAGACCQCRRGGRPGRTVVIAYRVGTVGPRAGANTRRPSRSTSWLGTMAKRCATSASRSISRRSSTSPTRPTTP